MSSTGTILIVDDDLVGRKTLETKLFGEKYKVFSADDGKEALKIMKRVSPDLILLDVLMPEMDGFEVCQHLKADPRWRHIPIIMVTSLDNREDVMRGFEAGADDFLHKPVNSFELRTRVRSMIKAKQRLSALDAAVRLRENLESILVDEMRAPLVNILDTGRRVKKRVTDPENVVDLRDLVRQAEQLESLINAMLLLVKQEGDSLLLKRSETDLNELVAEIAGKYSEMALLKQIKLTTHLPEKSQKLALDSALFRYALDNLTLHALESSPAESLVSIQVEYPGSEKIDEPIRIKVMDEAPTIPPERRTAIFDESKSTGRSKSDTSQTRANLALCKMVVKAHGGRISVEPNEPTGNIFTVEI